MCLTGREFIPLLKEVVMRGNLVKDNFTVPPLVARSEVHRTHHPVEVEMVAGVRQSHLAAVPGQWQNRQIQSEGGVLRALPARLPPLALAAVNLNIRSQPEKKGGKAE